MEEKNYISQIAIVNGEEINEDWTSDAYEVERGAEVEGQISIDELAAESDYEEVSE
jgi:hypothetical protein